MIFRYREIEKGKFAPIVELVIYGEDRPFCFEAFIDSGADYSVFDESSAYLLGLDLKKGTKVPITVGDGDRMIAYLHEVEVSFADKKFKTPICFSSALGAGFNLIGRKGFFQKFTICFHERAKYVSVH